MKQNPPNNAEPLASRRSRGNGRTTSCLIQKKARATVAAIHGSSNPTPEQSATRGVRCYASVIELRPEKEREYRELHADVWPEVKAAIHKANIRNYNIFVTEMDGKKCLFSHFEYVGRDPEKDLAGIAQDPTTRDRWWPLTDVCQIRPTDSSGNPSNR